MSGQTVVLILVNAKEWLELPHDERPDGAQLDLARPTGAGYCSASL